MKLPKPVIELLQDLFVAGDMSSEETKEEIGENPARYLVSLALALEKEASEVGSTVSFTLLEALSPENLEKAEEFLQEETSAK